MSECINVKKLKSVSGSDVEFCKELIDAYLKDSARIYSELMIALETNSYPDIARLAHSLKGSSSHLGAQYLQEACAAVYKRASKLDALDSNKVPDEVLHSLSEEISRIKPCLDEVFQRLKELKGQKEIFASLL